jgi:hypothetical protein
MNITLNLNSLTQSEISQIQKQITYKIQSNKLTVPYFTSIAPLSSIWKKVIAANDIWWEFYKGNLYLKGSMSGK